jgi:malonyl-CoA O-methyltransferase
VTAPRVNARIDTVRRQFDARAARFARHDALVREIGDRMLERLSFMRHATALLVDLGCGSGACRGALQRQFPQARWLGLDLSAAMLRAGGQPARWHHRLGAWLGARLDGGWVGGPGTRPGAGPGTGLAGRLDARPGAAGTPAFTRAGGDASLRACASAECLPLADASVDLVFSNLMLHWHPAPHAVIAEIARVLKTGGLVMFSSYGPDTGKELRAACAASLPAARPMPCIDMHDFGDMLVDSGFEAPVMEVETLQLTFGSARALLTEARALGGNPRDDRASALPSGRQARALLRALEAGADAQGRLALSFEVVIGHGWKAAPRTGVQTIAMPRRLSR